MTEFIRAITLALTLASATWSSHPFLSARDQYEAGEDGPSQLPAEATDHRREARESTVKKRSYEPWTGQRTYNQPYDSISVWKPPLYQLSRPYYVPIYGIPGRVPIYFPPQPLNINPGTPAHNPDKRPFKGPAYLPPAERATPTATTMRLDDRFGEEQPYEDRRQIWDGGDEAAKRTTTTETVPTRRPRPPGLTRPPLLHNPDGGDGDVAQRPQAQTTRRRRPPPTTPRPTQSSRPSEPSQCVWAIISCCSSSGQISYDCFDQRGCPGAFWDHNPCDSEFARAAIAAALKYYSRK